MAPQTNLPSRKSKKGKTPPVAAVRAAVKDIATTANACAGLLSAAAASFVEGPAGTDAKPPLLEREVRLPSAQPLGLFCCQARFELTVHAFRAGQEAAACCAGGR